MRRRPWLWAALPTLSAGAAGASARLSSEAFEQLRELGYVTD